MTGTTVEPLMRVGVENLWLKPRTLDPYYLLLPCAILVRAVYAQFWHWHLIRNSSGVLVWHKLGSFLETTGKFLGSLLGFETRFRRDCLLWQYFRKIKICPEAAAPSSLVGRFAA